MGRKGKAEAANSDPKTNFTDGEINMLSYSDSTTGFESVEQIIDRLTASRSRNVIRLYACFACNRHFPIGRMSSALIICRLCLKDFRDKGQVARVNRIDRVTNTLRIFLRGRLEAR